MCKQQPLTAEEQRLAEENLYMVDRFLRERRIDPNEYYDVVVFGYLEAIQYHTRVSPENNLFSLCMAFMRRKLWMEYRRMLAYKRLGDRTALSLDHPLKTAGDSSFFLLETVHDKQQDIAQQAEALDLIHRMLSIATPREREAMLLACAGNGPKEIAQMLGIARETASSTLYHFRVKAKAVRDEREVVSYPRQNRERKRRLSDVADQTGAQPQNEAATPLPPF